MERGPQVTVDHLRLSKGQLNSLGKMKEVQIGLEMVERERRALFEKCFGGRFDGTWI